MEEPGHGGDLEQDMVEEQHEDMFEEHHEEQDEEDDDEELPDLLLEQSEDEDEELLQQIGGAGVWRRILEICPTQEEKQRAMRLMAARGFPGCFSSWDCKHFVWKNCPVRLACQTQGKGGASSVVPGRHPSTSQLLCDTP
jgi:hypothetical protein